MRVREAVALHNRSMLLRCAGCVFFWGLLAHVYGFVNGIFSHDSLNALAVNATEELWKIQLGRFMVPVYRAIIREGVAMPWLIGVLSLLYLGAAVYLIVRLFRMQSFWPVFLTAGVFTTNLTVTALTATYLYELDLDMLALLLAVLSVYVWREKKWGFWAGAALLAISMGFYQAYFSVALVLIMLVSIMELLGERPFKEVFFRGLRGIAMLALGGVLYAGAVKAACALVGTELADGYNGLTNLLAASDTPLYRWIVRAYYFCLNKIAHHLIPAYSDVLELAINGILLVITLWVVVGTIIRKKIRPLSAALLLALGCLLPLGMDILYILDRGMMHDLMIFSFYSVYLLVLLLVFQPDLRGTRATVLRCLSCALIAALLWGNVQSANALYLKKDLEKSSTLSWMTRVAERIETYPDYIADETPVAIYGKYEQDTIAGFDDYAGVTGAGGSSAVIASAPSDIYNIYKAYFSYILNVPINLCDGEAWHRLRESGRLEEMPSFPDEGCVEMIDGTLVVKLGDAY